MENQQKEKKEIDVIEGNRIIAEFADDIKTPLGVKPILVHSDYLKYHSSWDWLMPVVEKIASLNQKDGKEWYYYTMSHCHFRIYANTPFGISGEWMNNSNTTLNATWLTVIEFIQWHNQNQQP